MTNSFQRLILSGVLLLLPATILGVVRDASGAVLPGVTVEAASPALIEKVVLPDTYYLEPRFHQLDLRFGRLFRLSRAVTIRPQVDVFNALNNNSVLGVITQVGPVFNLPIQVLDPRVVKFGVDVNF